MMRKNILVIIGSMALSVLTTLLQAQTNDSKLLVMGVPQYLIVDGLRIDFDFKLKNENKWLSVTPLLFLQGNEKDEFSSFDYEYGYSSFDEETQQMLMGVGVEVIYKQFLSKQNGPIGLYLGFGPNFKYVNIHNYSYYWEEFTNNGMQFEKQTLGYNTTEIYKMGANCILGYQMEISKNFFLDGFLGFGVRYSLRYNDKGIANAYNSNWIDHGYTGVLLVSGIRFGVGF